MKLRKNTFSHLLYHPVHCTYVGKKGSLFGNILQVLKPLAHDYFFLLAHKKPQDGNQSPFSGIKSVDQQTENQILVWIDNFGSVDFERIEESGTQG